MSSRRRDKLYIIAEISEIAKDGISKTQIMYRANLSFTQLNNYLRFLLKINLVDKTGKDGQELYITTEKGLDFLQRYREITDLLRYHPDVSKCPHCQKDVSPDHEFCPYCGTNLSIERVKVKIE